MNKLVLILLSFIVIVVAIAMLIGMYALGTYNNLVIGQETISTSWAQVETQYQRRFDLIPGLVSSTKSILKQEQAVFGAIAEARTHYANPSASTDEKVAATNQMESALSRLLVVIENYPQLKSDQTVRGLMDELAGTENRIQISRERYNEAVKTWNVQVKTFPRSIIANVFGFSAKTFFDSEENANKAVPVILDI